MRTFREYVIYKDSQLTEGFWSRVWGAVKIPLGLVGATAHGVDASLATTLGPGYANLVGRNVAGDYNKQQWGKTLGSLKYTGEGFSELFDGLFKQVDLGLIPVQHVLNQLKKAKPEAVPLVLQVAHKGST